MDGASPPLHGWRSVSEKEVGGVGTQAAEARRTSVK